LSELFGLDTHTHTHTRNHCDMDDSYKEEFERFKAGGSNMLAQSERSRKRVDVHALHLAPRLASYRNEEGVSTSHPHAPMAYALYASDGFLETRPKCIISMARKWG
jgi:hypothetical protein